uniref:RING-type domain-containing protein n=1 Tax=Caenorhabditis tropicalis TaxID=1561998 RepID=A0A1I7TRI1_9PELO
MQSTTNSGSSSSGAAGQETLVKQLAEAKEMRSKMIQDLKTSQDSVEAIRDAIAEIDKKQRKLLECPICYTQYDKQSRVPLILTCGHTCCARCIAHQVRRQAINSNSPVFKLLCFYCRQETNSTTKNFDIELFSINKIMLDALPTDY